MTFITLFALLIIFVLSKTAIIVPARTICVKERLGKFAGIMNPGFHILVPFMDRVAYRHEAREQVFDVPAQSCISRDNIQIEVDGLVYIKVLDPVKASYGIENYRVASINLAQTTMRSEVGKLLLHESLSEREKLNNTVVSEIDKASASWGIKVLRYEIKDLTPPKEILLAMQSQITAEREKRALIAASEGRRQEQINIATGEREAFIARSEGEKQAAINKAQGDAAAITEMANATAQAIERIAAAIRQPGGEQAVQLKVAEQAVHAYAKVAQDAKTTLIVPGNMSEVSGLIASAMQMVHTGKQAN